MLNKKKLFFINVVFRKTTTFSFDLLFKNCFTGLYYKTSYDRNKLECLSLESYSAPCRQALVPALRVESQKGFYPCKFLMITPKEPGKTKGRSITVPLTSCLTCLESAV